jgi:hypothetical protein
LALSIPDAIVYLEDRGRTAASQWVLVGAIMLSAVSLGGSYFANRWYRTGDPNHVTLHEKHRDWREVCYWIDRNLAADERFLTPRFQQTFKWYAGRSEVVTWKDMPQDAQGLVQWRDRFYDVFRTKSEIPGSRWRRSLTKIDIETLRQLAREYDFKYVVVDRTVRDVKRHHRDVIPVFRNNCFAVFRVREAPAE